MSVAVLRVGPVGSLIKKIITVTLATGTAQAAKVGGRVVSAIGQNQTEKDKAPLVKQNFNQAGVAADGYIQVTNADAGPDTVVVECLVSE